MTIHKVTNGYRVDWRNSDGKRHRKTFRTRKLAEAHERAMRDLRDQGVTPTDQGGTTLNDFIPTWIRVVYPSLRTNTTTGYDSALRGHIKPGLGDYQLAKIDQRVVQEYVASLSEKGLSARSVEYQFAIVSSILRLASEYGLAQPIRKASRGHGGVRLPKKTPRRVSPPTVEEVERLCDAIDARSVAMIRLAAYCGLRQSEVLGLHPSSVDCENGVVYVRRTLTHADRTLVDLTKSGKERVVTMPHLVSETMRTHIAEYATSDLVFHKDGRRIHPSVWHRWVWKPAREKARLEHVRFHDLRHSAASIMAQSGWSAKEAQEELGHHSAAFTLDRYSHLWPEDRKRRREGLDEALRAQIDRVKTKEAMGDGESRRKVSIDPYETRDG